MRLKKWRSTQTPGAHRRERGRPGRWGRSAHNEQTTQPPTHHPRSERAGAGHLAPHEPSLEELTCISGLKRARVRRALSALHRVGLLKSSESHSRGCGLGVGLAGCGSGDGPRTVVRLDAAADGSLRLERAALRTGAGRASIEMRNPSDIPHAIGICGKGGRRGRRDRGQGRLLARHAGPQARRL
jgi:hypothetical protein